MSKLGLGQYDHINRTITLTMITLSGNRCTKYPSLSKNMMSSWSSSILTVENIDAKSFSNSFEGVHGVVRKPGRGSSIFVFFCIFMLQFSNSFEGVHGVVRKPGRGSSIFVFNGIAFLCYNFSKSFEGVHKVPPSSPPPVCIYGSVGIQLGGIQGKHKFLFLFRKFASTIFLFT